MANSDMVQQGSQALHTNRELPEAAVVIIDPAGQSQATLGACAVVIKVPSAGRLTVCACRGCGLC